MRCLLGLFGFAMVAAGGSGQTPLWHADRAVGVASLGDVNRDGHGDVVVAASPNTLVLSGKDGTVLATTMWSSAVAELSDVDNDGLPDFAVLQINSHGGRGSVTALSSRDARTVLFQVVGTVSRRLSHRLRHVGDIDGDGTVDLGVWANDPARPTNRFVLVLSGKDGRVSGEYGGSAAVQFGHDFAGAGDLDRDGHDDVVVGAPCDDDGGRDAGAVIVHSGKTGKPLRKISGTLAFDRFGQTVDGGRDIDGDGVPDLAAGAQFGAYVQALSGSTGKALVTIRGRLADRFGESPVRIIDDRDGDKRPDLLAGAAAAPFRFVEGDGEAYVFSSKTGLLLWKTSKVGTPRFFGGLVAQLGDLDRDGLRDLAALGGGYIRAISGRLLPLHSDRSEIRAETQTLEIDAGPGHGGKPHLIAGSVTGTCPGIGLGSHTLPLVPDAYLLLTLLAPNALLGNQIGMLDAKGRATASFTMPQALLRPLDKQVFRHAFVVFGNGTFDFTSNAFPTRITASN